MGRESIRYFLLDIIITFLTGQCDLMNEEYVHLLIRKSAHDLWGFRDSRGNLVVIPLKIATWHFFAEDVTQRHSLSSLSQNHAMSIRQSTTCEAHSEVGLSIYIKGLSFGFTKRLSKTPLVKRGNEQTLWFLGLYFLTHGHLVTPRVTSLSFKHIQPTWKRLDGTEGLCF